MYAPLNLTDFIFSVKDLIIVHFFSLLPYKGFESFPFSHASYVAIFIVICLFWGLIGYDWRSKMSSERGYFQLMPSASFRERTFNAFAQFEANAIIFTVGRMFTTDLVQTRSQTWPIRFRIWRWSLIYFRELSKLTSEYCQRFISNMTNRSGRLERCIQRVIDRGEDMAAS